MQINTTIERSYFLTMIAKIVTLFILKSVYKGVGKSVGPITLGGKSVCMYSKCMCPFTWSNHKLTQ